MKLEQRTWLKIARLTAGYLRQQDLADAIEVSSELVSMWESGARRPSPSRIATLAKLLGPEVASRFDAEIEAESQQAAS